MRIEQIQIEGLFGEINYRIKPEDNKLILVAENGSGKTTIVNIIYYFLSRQWNKLNLFNFSSITAVIDGASIEVKKEDLTDLSSKNIERLTRKLPIHLRNELRKYFSEEDFSELYRNPSKVEYLIDKFNLPRSFVHEMLEEFKIRQVSLFDEPLPDKQKMLTELVDCQILYLPTYRRIEQELGVIFPHLESDIEKYERSTKFGRMGRFRRIPQESGYVELVEFGMEDVRKKIRGKLIELAENLNNRIKNNLTGGYLRDVINKTYLQISYEQIQEFSEIAFNSMLDRIDESLLSNTEKSKLIEFVNEISQRGKIEKEETKLIAYFIYKLSTIYNNLKKEEKDIEQFISLCNEYLSNKRFIYDNINFDISVRPLKNGKIQEKEKIELRALSSGEKQIVSLFSHLFLSEHKDFFLVIDEPELSLSVPWQERFLVDVVNNPYCKGLLAVTHSPFIFENQLDKYAHGLNEFYYQ